MEGYIFVASSIPEHKNGPFKTTAGITIKFALGKCE
jgi:hypothetical protein